MRLPAAARSETMAAIALGLAALAVRLPPALAAPAPTSDAADYLRLAEGLRQGRGLVSIAGQPTAFRPPLYPLLLAGLGAQPRTAIAFQVLLGSSIHSSYTFREDKVISEHFSVGELALNGVELLKQRDVRTIKAGRQCLR